jgi:hypothetical protein
MKEGKKEIKKNEGGKERNEQQMNKQYIVLETSTKVGALMNTVINIKM